MRRKGGQRQIITRSSRRFGNWGHRKCRKDMKRVALEFKWSGKGVSQSYKLDDCICEGQSAKPWYANQRIWSFGREARAESTRRHADLVYRFRIVSQPQSHLGMVPWIAGFETETENISRIPNSLRVWMKLLAWMEDHSASRP